MSLCTLLRDGTLASRSLRSVSRVRRVRCRHHSRSVDVGIGERLGGRNVQIPHKPVGNELSKNTVNSFESTFEFFTNYTKMPILAFSSLLHENKKNPVIKCYPEWE